jgi:hypothetical protein
VPQAPLQLWGSAPLFSCGAEAEEGKEEEEGEGFAASRPLHGFGGERSMSYSVLSVVSKGVTILPFIGHF